MKKVLAIGLALGAIMALACCGSSKAGDAVDGIVFESGTFSQALAKAKAENKLLFIDAYASWCGPCKRMASEVFTQKSVGDYFNANFVSWKFDVEQGEGVMLARRYNVTSYPTFLLVDGDGVLKGTMIGGSPADDFIKKMKLLVEKAKQ